MGEGGGTGHLREASRPHRRPIHPPLRGEGGRLVLRHPGGRVGALRSLQPGGERPVERGRPGGERGGDVPRRQEEGCRTAPPQLARHTRYHSGQNRDLFFCLLWCKSRSFLRRVNFIERKYFCKSHSDKIRSFLFAKMPKICSVLIDILYTYAKLRIRRIVKIY